MYIVAFDLTKLPKIFRASFSEPKAPPIEDILALMSNNTIVWLLYDNPVA